MKTAIQELIEKYNEHLKFDDDLDSLSGRDILKIVIVDLSYQVKEKEQHGETWDSALKAGEDRAWNVMRAYSDFDEYWDKLNK